MLARARFGAVSFIHRFGDSLNRHFHYHCCVIDGACEPIEDASDGPQSVRFRPAADLTPEVVAAIADQARVRAQRWFARSGLIELENAPRCASPKVPTQTNRRLSLDAALRCNLTPNLLIGAADHGLKGDVSS